MTILYYSSKNKANVSLHDHTTSPDLPKDMLDKKKRVLSEDEKDFIYKCGRVWRARSPLTVVVKERIDARVLFGKYFDKVKEKIDNGIVRVKIESELTMSDLENFIEFN